jgi:hypothetical protein
VLPLFIAARVEGMGIEAQAGSFDEALDAGRDAAASALRMEKDADLPERIAASARKLDAGAAGPLLRAGDAADYYLASLTTALTRQSEYYEVYQANRAAAQEFARKLGKHTDPALHELEVVVSAIAANDAGSAYGALAEQGHLGESQAALLLKRISMRVQSDDANFLAAILLNAHRFDTRVVSRIRWAYVRDRHLYERAEPRKLYASVLRDSPSNHPEMATTLAWLSRDAASLKGMALEKSLPFSNRKTALDDYLALAEPAAAEETLRAFADSEPSRYEAQLPLIYFLGKTGKPAAARALAMNWLDKYEEPSRALDAAHMRCEASRQDFDTGHWSEGLQVIQPALPAYPFCALALAGEHLIMLGRKEEGNKLVEAWLKRYTDPVSVAEAAFAYWLEGDHAAAANVLVTSPRPLGNADYRWTVGGRFAKVFSKRPAADVKEPVKALFARGLHPGYVSDIGMALAREGAAEHAFVLGSMIDVPPPDRYMQLLRTTSALRSWKGAQAAREWLWARIPKPLEARGAYDLALYAYREMLDEDLFLLPDPEGSPSLADAVWLFRAAALARLGEQARPEMRAPVQAHFAAKGAGRQFQLGRYLMGLLPEQDLPALVTDDSASCEVPYYAGIKAQADHKTDEATARYRDAILCLKSGEAEYLWAHDALRRIRDNEKAGVAAGQ